MPLSEAQQNELVKRLDERERLLTEEVRRQTIEREDYQLLAGEAPDPGDQATADVLRDINHAEVGRDVAELRAIEAARQRMREGDYGVCADCGVDIPFERLQIEPAALRCAQCQSMREKTYASAGPGASL